MPDSPDPSVDGAAEGRWRTGGHGGRTIIAEGSGEPDGHGRRPDDRLVGVMDTPELATEVVAAVNRERAEPAERRTR
jgi:hypothetical protein